MNWKEGLRQPGVMPALLAALLFGAGTLLAKLLLESVSLWLLAGLLYLGFGGRARALSPHKERTGRALTAPRSAVVA